jgi:hypothetical protein
LKLRGEQQAGASKAASIGGLFHIGQACDVAYWQIVLQKSKIGRHRKSRESRILGDSAAAILCDADTKLRGRFSDER